MKNYIPQFLRSFRFRSIFIRTFFSIITVCLILCAFFSFLFSRSLVKQHQEKLFQDNRQYLEAMINNSENMIREMMQSQTQMSDTSTILKLIFSKKMDKERISNVQLEMLHLADSNLIIKNAFLYVPSFDIVVSSNRTGAYQYRKESPFSDIIDIYQSDFSDMAVLSYNNEKSTLFTINQEIVLVRDFPLTGENRLASLYYILYPSGLKGVFGAEISIYSAEKELLTEAEKRVSDISNETLRALLEEKSQENIPIHNNIGYFHHISDFTGWHYVYFADFSLLDLSWKQLYRQLLPVILLMIFLSIFLSFLIAFYIYRPISKLADSISDSELPDTIQDSSRNELEYFSGAYLDVLQRKKELNKMLESISHDTTSRILHNLIADTMSEEEKQKLPELLTIIRSPFHENDLCRIILVEFEKKVDDIEKEKIILLNDLIKLCNDLNRSYDCHSHALMMHGLVYSIIIAFPKSSLLLSVKKAKGEFISTVENYAQEHDIKVFVGSGHTYNSIYDLTYSHKDAVSSLQKKKNYTENSNEPMTDSTENDTMADFNIYSQHILNTLLGDSSREAHKLADRVILQIEDTCSTMQQQADYYNTFINFLVDKILKIEYIDHLPVTGDDFTLIIQSKQEQVSSEELKDAASSICHELITETSRILKQQKNPYILAAQKYITLHYQDDNLSLNSVAYAIDINPSYLSRLFKNSLGIKFTDFLNGYRINRSIELLEQSQKSVSSISEETGFSSVQNFIRVFKKITGFTPKQYRKAHTTDTGTSD